MRNFRILARLYRLSWAVLLGILLLGRSIIPPTEQTERVRAFTRDIEFDFVSWTVNALRVKSFEAALATGSYLSLETRHKVVLDYLQLVGMIQQLERKLILAFTDPSIQDPRPVAAALRQQLTGFQARLQEVAPLAEAILQSQISYVVDQLGLTLGGQPIPPVLYHATPLPLALIVSPRQVIRQDEDISLIPEIPVDERSDLESRVDQALNVSSLVVDIGGVGTYPTMIEQTDWLEWLNEVVAHEWVHNFLTLRPLGVNYMASPELRIMNETTASIAGKEIGRLVLETFYPELVPEPPPPTNAGSQSSTPSEPPAFDFRAEMHTTRIAVDQLLAEGKIEQAEVYMEMRRKFIWDNGYGIRKLNQAYFAFHGAYADEAGGAAGATEDPVGAAVRALRQQSPSLAAFLNRISWMVSFEQLLQAAGD